MSDVSLQLTGIVPGAIRLVIANNSNVDAASERLEILVPIDVKDRNQGLAAIQLAALERARETVEKEIDRIRKLGHEALPKS
jgi:hypothetical protein